jgi:glycerol-3-phosphate dehydrogenase (NAD(P)+)
MKTQKIVIVGNGKIGNAILHLLSKSPKDPDKRNFVIDIYDNDNSKNQSGKTLEECLQDADFVFFCIPSWHTKQALMDIKPYIKPETILVSVAKGLEASSGQTIDELIETNLKNAKYALLSGPMFAVEIMENEMSFAILASKEMGIFEEISKLFTGTKLKLEYSKEVHAVAISAVLKNIYALIVSMIRVPERGNNTEGYLCSKSAGEIIEIMKTLKLNSEIGLGVSGLGDFAATASSKFSQNRKVGEEIFSKGKSSVPSEGLISLPSLIQLLGKKSEELPLLSLAEKILIKNKDPKTEIEKYFV